MFCAPSMCCVVCVWLDDFVVFVCVCVDVYGCLCVPMCADSLQSHFGLRRVFAAALGHPLFRRMEPEEAARLLCRDYIVELAICAQVNSG